MSVAAELRMNALQKFYNCFNLFTHKAAGKLASCRHRMQLAVSSKVFMVVAPPSCGGGLGWNWKAARYGDGLAPGGMANDQAGL
jgi:hypothetical protein